MNDDQQIIENLDLLNVIELLENSEELDMFEHLDTLSESKDLNDPETKPQEQGS